MDVVSPRPDPNRYPSFFWQCLLGSLPTAATPLHFAPETEAFLCELERCLVSAEAVAIAKQPSLPESMLWCTMYHAGLPKEDSGPEAGALGCLLGRAIEALWNGSVTELSTLTPGGKSKVMGDGRTTRGCCPGCRDDMRDIRNEVSSVRG